MSEPIKPALTEREWATGSVPIPSPQCGDIEAWTHEDGVLSVGCGHAEVLVPREHRHALAALALHGQPEGFTWADVDALAAALECIVSAQQDRAVTKEDHAYFSADYAVVEHLRNRIAALLPPRENGAPHERAP